MDIDSLRNFLADESELELAILIGSRATNTARPDSDWDIAIQWERSPDRLGLLGKTETLRRKLARLLGVPENNIDLIDLPTARLAMRAVVADQGILIKGDGALAWHRFLQRTWRELEEYQREKTDAA